MNLARRPKIVLLGMMTKMPVAGVIWQTIHYLVGLQRLGFEVYYAEDHGMNPSMFTETEEDNGGAKAAAFIARAMSRFDLGPRWSYHAWHSDGGYYGVGKSRLHQLYKDSAAVINLHGGTMPRDEHRAGGPLIFLGTDPVALEVELHEKFAATEEFLDAHDAFFTFGENLGAADCKLPLPPERYRFHPTRQPVVVDLWHPYRTGAGERFTTVGNWLQPWRDVTFKGEIYRWSKHYEFLKFIDLPQRTSQQFELALSSYEPADREMLEANGWRVRHGLDVSVDIDEYRQYIAGSRGEWTVAKDQNIRLRSGWFSDRSATYLAAGRPVITQETGFSNVLPTGEGLFGFSSIEEILDAVEQVNADYQRHSRAAHQIAREQFSYDVVLPQLLEQSGVTMPSRVLAKRTPLQAAKQNGSSTHPPVPLEAAPQIPFVDGVNVIGYLQTESGVGEAGRSYVRALQTLDTPVSLRDVSDLCGNRAEDRSLHFEQPEEAYDVNLVCVDIEKHFGVLARFGEEFFNGRYNIGVWAWETQEFPKKWFDRFAYYDEIWVGTSFIADYLAPISPIPVLRVPPILTRDETGSRQAGRERLGVTDDEFVFLFVFDGNSTFHRKNPLAIIEAFRAAFPSDERVRLVFKSVNANNYPRDFAALKRRAQGWPVSIHDGYWPAGEVRDLMAACDAYVSLHRSEGTGLTIADAMANAKPVIATGWSGNMDFMTHANSYPVRYEMIGIEPDSTGPYRHATGAWAEASLDHAAEMMRHVYEHRSEAAARGQLAKEHLARQFSAERTAEIIRQRLRAIALRRRFSEFQNVMKQRYSAYSETVRRIRKTVATELPLNANIAVAARGDEQLVRFSDRTGWHFPQTAAGVYAGDHPPDSRAAIDHLEQLRRSGAEYFLVPNTMFWWFESYPEFKSHLDCFYRTAHENESCVIYDLRAVDRGAPLLLRPGVDRLLGDIKDLRSDQGNSADRLVELVQGLRVASEKKQRALRELEAKLQHASNKPAPVVEPVPPPPQPVSPYEKKREEYRRVTEQIRADVHRVLPLDATLAVITRGDSALLSHHGRRAWHFPRTAEGQWAGHHPANSDAAVEHLEELRRRGLQFLVIPAPYLWWLDHYAGWANHLATNYQLLLRDEFCTIYDVRENAHEISRARAEREKEEHRELTRRIRSEVQDVIPLDATVAVATLGDAELLHLEGRRAWHFPRTETGSYAADFPMEGAAMIGQLEQMRERGLQYLVVPRSAFSWLDSSPDLHSHLAREYQLIRSDDACVIYSVRESATDAQQAESRAKRTSYLALAKRLREFISAAVPLDATVSIVSKGDAELLNLNGRRAWHFPRTAEGEYAGRHPDDSATAIAELELHRERGTDYFLLPSPYFWWLDFYADFAAHLATKYTLVQRNDDCILYDVRGPASDGKTDDRPVVQSHTGWRGVVTRLRKLIQEQLT